MSHVSSKDVDDAVFRRAALSTQEGLGQPPTATDDMRSNAMLLSALFAKALLSAMPENVARNSITVRGPKSAFGMANDGISASWTNDEVLFESTCTLFEEAEEQ